SISRADVGRRGAAESVGALVRAAGAEVRWLRGSEELLEGDDRIGQVEAAVIVRVACIEAGGRHGGGARSEEPEERTDRVGDVDRRIAVAIASREAASWIDDDAERLRIELGVDAAEPGGEPLAGAVSQAVDDLDEGADPLGGAGHAVEARSRDRDAIVS